MGCSATPTVEDGCAHVIDATITPTGLTYQVSATVSSADTGWDKYADRWVVRTETGFVLRERDLAHPHVHEQPFTRTMTGLEVPDGEDVLEFAARDSVEGFCGTVFVLEVPGR